MRHEWEFNCCLEQLMGAVEYGSCRNSEEAWRDLEEAR